MRVQYPGQFAENLIVAAVKGAAEVTLGLGGVPPASCGLTQEAASVCSALRRLLQESEDVAGNFFICRWLGLLPLAYAPVSQLHPGRVVTIIREPTEDGLSQALCRGSRELW